MKPCRGTVRPGVSWLTGALLTLVLGGCATGRPAGAVPTEVSAAGSISAVGDGNLPGVGDLPAPASAWPAAGFDARHSSGTSAVGPRLGTVKWTAEIGGNVTPGPVIAVDGSVLAGSNNGILHSLDPATGARRWEFDGAGSFGSDLSTSPAVLTDGTILWPGPDNTLFALSSAGKLLWQEEFIGQVLSPAIAGFGRVYVSDLAGHLTAFEVTTTGHRRVWTVDVGGPDYASATVGPDGTIYTASGNDLVAVRDTGEAGVERWRFQAKSLVEVSNAIAHDGTVVLGTNDDDEYGIHPDGSIAWRFDKDRAYTYSSSVVTSGGLAYFGDHRGRLHVLSTTDGAVAPSAQGAGQIWTAPAVDAKGNFYFATQNGHIQGFTALAEPLFDLTVGGAINSYPAIDAAGTLYFGTVDGHLLAIG